MTDELQLYCQSCCARYPYCIWKDTLHRYDQAAETCPDFLPKDIYKGIKKAKCWKKRLGVDPDFEPLPIDAKKTYTRESLDDARKYAIKKNNS